MQRLTLHRTLPTFPSRKYANTGVPRFQFVGQIKTSVTEASDTVGLPNGRFLVVSDKKTKIRVVDSIGRQAVLDLPRLKKGKSEFEAVAFDAKRNHLFVAREEEGVILRYHWDPTKSEPPKFEKRFKVRLDHTEWGNKGIEGLTFLRGKHSPTGKAVLLAAKEGNPRRFFLLDRKGGGDPREIKVDQAIRDVAKDFSALAIDPKTGTVFLGSDESGVVVQIKLFADGKKIRGELMQVIPLEDKYGRPLKRIEGLAFNPAGDLHVLTENDGVLHVLKRSTVW